MCVLTVLILYIFIKHQVVFVMSVKLITTNGVSFATGIGKHFLHLRTQ